MTYSTTLQKTLKLFAVIMMLALFILALSWTQSLYAAATQMYWVNYNNSAVNQANLDGTAAISNVLGTNPTSIALDTAAGKMYWTNYTANTISQANLDGTGVTTYPLTGVGNQPFAIALDTVADQLYWTNLGNSRIYRMEMDGTGTVQIVPSCAIATPKGIALDLVNGKMYVANAGNLTAGAGTIFRANLDGSSCELIQTGLTDPTDIALDIASGQMYWTSFNYFNEANGSAIFKAALSGGSVATLLSGLNQPAGLALDIPADKIYWVNFGANTISQADMGGTGATNITIVPGVPPGSVAGPHDIALVMTLPVVWDGGGGDNNWSTALNWSTDSVPGPTDSVLFDATSSKNAVIDAGFGGSVAELTIGAGYTGEITMNRSLAVSGNYLQGGGTFVVADPASTFNFTVGGIFKQMGGILKQTQTINNQAKNFLQIENGSSVVKYRGATVDTTSTTNNLGAVTVSVKAVDLAGGEYCTADVLSEPYAGRCFEITAINNLPADITLYALTTELNGITLTNIYRYVAPNWVQLASTPGVLGEYSFISATTPGFSSFLMGGTNAPTAVSLQSFSAESHHPEMLALVMGALLLLAAGSFWWLRRQDE